MPKSTIESAVVLTFEDVVYQKGRDDLNAIWTAWTPGRTLENR